MNPTRFALIQELTTMGIRDSIGVWSLFIASHSKKMVGDVISSTRFERVSLSLCAPPEMYNSFNHFFFFIDFRRG